MEAIESESVILSELEHPNIVRLYESILGKRQMYMILELCESKYFCRQNIG